MTDTLLSFENVSVRRGSRTVLRNLTFQINRGERIILTGENGCGKTTLLKTALGFLQPDSGNIYAVRGKGSDRFAYLPQFSLQGELPISAREVVAIGLVNSRLSKTEMNRKAQDLLKSLDCLNLADRPFAQLSGGEKQRVSLARCLAQAPDLLILDEPTASLDPQMRSRFYPLLLKLAESHKTAVLLVTHDLTGIPAEGWTRKRLAQQIDGTFLQKELQEELQEHLQKELEEKTEKKNRGESTVSGKVMQNA